MASNKVIKGYIEYIDKYLVALEVLISQTWINLHDFSYVVSYPSDVIVI